MFKLGERLRKSIDNLSDTIKKQVDVLIHPEKKDKYFEINQDLIEIYQRIYLMSFPSKEKIQQLSEYLNNQYKTNYYIWNVSEHTYDTSLFNNQVAEYCLVGYPCLSLALMLSICRSILSWLANDPNNIAILHCQSTKGRSALIISCLLCFLKISSTPNDALTYLCNKFQIDPSKLLFSTQKIYLNYFTNIFVDKIKLSETSIILKKVVFSEIPRLVIDQNNKQETQQIFRPYLQIFKNSKIIYNSLSEGPVKVFFQSDMALWFELDKEVIGDILIRCKNFHSNNQRSPVFRLMFNTGFTFNDVIRFTKVFTNTQKNINQQQEHIDFSPGFQVSDDFFIDFIVQTGETKLSKIQEPNINNLVAQLYTQEQEMRAIAKAQELSDKQQKDNLEDNSNSSQKSKEDLLNDQYIKAQLEEIHQNESDSINNDSEDAKTDEDNSLQNSNKELVNKLLTKIGGTHSDDEELEDQEIDDYINKLENHDEN